MGLPDDALESVADVLRKADGFSWVPEKRVIAVSKAILERLETEGHLGAEAPESDWLSEVLEDALNGPAPILELEPASTELDEADEFAAEVAREERRRKAEELARLELELDGELNSAEEDNSDLLLDEPEAPKLRHAERAPRLQLNPEEARKNAPEWVSIPPKSQ